MAGTALGALVGAGSTMAADRSRWKRDHFTREHTTRRELYSQYLAALSLTTHRLRDLRRLGPTAREERARQAGDVLSTSGAYQARYQMLITAPDALAEPTERAFRALRDLRDRFDQPDVRKDPEWDAAMNTVSETMGTLKQAMRDDLSTLV